MKRERNGSRLAVTGQTGGREVTPVESKRGSKEKSGEEQTITLTADFK